MTWSLALPEDCARLRGHGASRCRCPRPDERLHGHMYRNAWSASRLRLAGVHHRRRTRLFRFVCRRRVLALCNGINSLVAGAFGILLAMDWTRQGHLRRFEFPLLMLFSIVGMMLMVSAASLMTLYIGVELMSLPIYVLAAFARENVRSAEAGLKYFVLGALASGLLLYGISLVYGFAGTTEFSTVSVASR